MPSKRALIAATLGITVAASAIAETPAGDSDFASFEAASDAHMEASIQEALAVAQEAAARQPVDIQELAVATAVTAERAATAVEIGIDGVVEQRQGNRTIVPPELADSLYSGHSTYTGHSTRITVFVSRSLGRQALAEIFEELRYYPNARAVFRGVAAGQSLGEGIKEILALVRPDAEDRVANIEIDPIAFARHDINAVPTMIAEHQRTGELLLRVDGGTSVAFLARALADQSSRDSPLEIRLGSLTAIGEQDIIERAKATMESLDLDEKRRKALDRAFSRLTAGREGATYPSAEIHRRRIVDPRIEVLSPQGAPAANHLSNYVEVGTRINPLEMRPFTQVLVILDPTEGAQRAAAETALSAHLAAHPERRATWIATRLDADAGWDGLAAIEDRVNAPVYLIDERIRSRFQVERVPSLVYAEDRMFVVEEIPSR